MSMPDLPFTYRLHYIGQLSQHWLGHFADLQLRVEEVPGSPPSLFLSGVFKDQAALLGTLQTLYNLGCVLVSVESLL